MGLRAYFLNPIIYKKKLGYKNVKHVYVLEPGMNTNEKLFLVQHDYGIRKILSKINADMDVLEFLQTMR